MNVAAVLDAERRRIEAILSAQPAAMADLLADDLCFIHTSGRRDDKDGTVAHFTDRVLFLACDQEAVEARLAGDLAILWSRNRNHVRIRATGVEHRFAAWATQVWRQEGGHWRLAAHQATRIPEE